MDKEDMVLYIHTNGILAIKEWNNAIYNSVDATREDHTEVSQKEKYKHHMILYVESKIWRKWTDLWNKNTIMDIRVQIGSCQREGGLKKRWSGSLGLADVSFYI